MTTRKYMQFAFKVLLYFTLLLVTAGAYAQQEISSLSEITNANGNYRLTDDASDTPGVDTFSGTLEAAIDPTTKMPYRITGLDKPLFTTLTGTVKNLVLEDVSISGSGNTGAIAATAEGAARIYNVGILSGSVGGTTNTGGLVGLLDGTARVINCYSYADITSGTNKGGIVGFNNVASSQSNVATMVMNCMFYGTIASGENVSPVYGGQNINNKNSGGLATYNYYLYRTDLAITKDKYNCALAVEEKFLNRFEIFRQLENSNKKLASIYATGSADDADQKMLKWVLETADRTIDNPKPYPVLKAQGYYPSIINPDFANAPDSASVGRNHGGKLGSKTLSVTISSVGSNAPNGASITTGSLTLQRTDKDFDRFNFNYDKVQLPYYNEVGEGNYTGNRVVTGWKITSITGGTPGTYTAADEWGGYNFADRNCTNKDLYSESGRVFSQGAYFDVPYGVTAITIEPYWGVAAYVSDQYYDVVYKEDGDKNYAGQSVNVVSAGLGTQANNNTDITINGSTQKVYTSINNARSALNIPTDVNSGTTVYDYAVVLVGNVHQAGPLSGDYTPYTITSVDLDNDNEPDYSFIFSHHNRQAVSPIRFDFLNVVGTAQAQKPNGTSRMLNVSIFNPKGWFEVTNTCSIYFVQFEGDNGNKTSAPIILLGGAFDQFTSTQNKEVTTSQQYIHLGSNCWFKAFGNGTHGDGWSFTSHVPVSVTGGDFDGFYLSGVYRPDAKIKQDNAECYISSGRFNEAAGAAQQMIDGDVHWQIYNADITNFYGGGINAAKPITGDITVDIFNSHVDTYCGGPKFGDMQKNGTTFTTTYSNNKEGSSTGTYSRAITKDGKVTTNATGCHFIKFFGAGYGGTSYSELKFADATSYNFTTLANNYTNDRGKYFTGTNTTYKSDYGNKGPGVATDFSYEFFVWSRGQVGARFYVKYASFSLAQCNDVESKLKKCIIENNFYGGGSIGKVAGTATSELENCEVKGSVYAGGYSASIPTVPIRNSGFTTAPKFNSQSGMFEPGVFSETTDFEWTAGTLTENTTAINTSDGNKIYTDADLTTLGEVAHTNLTIKGTTTVGESVYGGGEESSVGGNTEVNVQGGTIGTAGSGGDVYGNVYGGGRGKEDDVKAGLVKGNTTVNISSLPDNNTTKVLHNVYGGGAFGSVGTFTYDDSNNTITGYTSGGQATVNIVGGTFGTDGHDNGMVFGSSRGKEGNSLTDTNIDKLAWVYNTVVNVGTAGSATGPMVNGSVYGGGENGHNYQNAAVNIHSGTIGYTSYDPASGYDCGSVFGAGCGTDKYIASEVQHYNPLAGTVWGNTTIAIDGGHIRHNVYGGGAIGSAGKADGSAGKATITVTGGRIGTDGNDNGNIYGAPRGDSEATDAGIAQVVETEVNINYTTTPTSDNGEHTAQLIAGSVFGGGQSGVVRHNVVVNMNGGLVLNDLYGGSALANTNIGNATNYGTSSEAIPSTSTYTTTLNLHGGIVGHNVYGGGLGRKAATGVAPVAALVYGDVMVNLNKTIATDNCRVKGNVFGCNNYNGTPKGIPTVHVYKTMGYDESHKKSTDKDDTTYDVHAVYGGGNEAAYQPALSTSSTNVIIDGCDETSIQYVYGGGNAAPAPATQVTVNSCYEIGSLFGGGNGYDDLEDGSPNPGADVGLINGSSYGSGDATSTIYGGTIHEAYGASNQKGTIKGSIDLLVKESEGTCPLDIGKLVGAGKNADIDGDVILVMGCMPATKTPLVFGGADNANVNGNVELTVTSGTFGQVFGGNNLGGIIKGHIKVNIEETGCRAINIDELYLGGNQAAYSIFGYYDSGETLADGRTKYLPRTSTSDTHTAVANPAADATHSFPYAQPVLNVISCTSIGKVFGGGLGTGAAMYADPTVNINMVQGLYYSTISTADGNNPDQLGAIENVYGGGNEAAVYGNTTVNIGTEIGNDITLTSTGETKKVLGAYITGTVYGAGKGTETTPEAAVVAGNTQVNMAGGRVCRSIYGGGELGSVGTFTQFYDADQTYPYHKAGEPKACKAGTGLAEVIITGGTVGLNNQLMPDPSLPTSDDDYGYVFCASKGEADSVTYVNANKLAVVNTTHLEISGGLIIASVYGGSENGQVLDSTLVEIKGGQIGTGHYKEGDTHRWDGLYDEADWTAAINKIKAGTFADADAAGFHECDAWPFGDEDHRFVYDYYAGTPGYDSQTGASPGSNGHSFFGNVFGGGSGYYPFAAGQWRATAGRVNGNTRVVITGGHVLTNVYGGNEISDVVGKSTVHMSGGTVGVPRSHAAIAAHPVNSYIFGAGMGDPRPMFNGKSNVGSAEVIVSDNAFVFGSVFGGGEDGHVLGDAKTTIKGNAHIGTFGDSSVDGNLFGSGRGFSAMALTAGVVCGNVTVTIQDNAKLLGSVFGGGRLAAVGTYLAEATDTEHYGIMQPGDDHGNVTINITGGTIGNQALMSTSPYSIGDVFGGSKGAILDDWRKNQALGLVKNTKVNISQATGKTTTIYGNVYGGGEIASVGSYEYATAAEATAYNEANPSEPLSEGDVNRLLEAGTGVAKINITGGIIGQNDVTDTHGHVFGGCLGRAGTQYSGYSFVNTSDVTLQGGTVYGCVFGGGENGHVLADTDVKIKSGFVGIALDKDNIDDANLSDNMIYRGNVYGGGRGIDKTDGVNYSITAGKVTGNTNVTIEGGTVYRAVYGGGSLASVGNPDEKAKTDLQPNGTYYSTGLATVTIKGGRIGSDGGASANTFTGGTPGREHRRENGFVFGSGRGMAAGASDNAQFSHLAYVKNTVVNIESGAIVTGSVFGGGENGHVRHDTKVYVKGGSIGTALTAIEQEIDNSGRSRLIYRGNVYGGGRGVDRNDENKLSKTAGRVYGNAYVEVNDGQIYHDVFGGGELGSVGTITGSTKTVGTSGTLGGQPMMFGFLLSMPYTFEYDKDASGKATTGLCTVKVNGGKVGGDVFGASRGQAGEIYEMAEIANIINSDVYIGADGSSSTTTPDIHGSVYGGGENGHILEDAHVTINGGLIGQSVFGSGQGTDKYAKKLKRWEDNSEYDGEAYSLTAGKVYGNTYVDMKGGLVTVNVYGGGKLASIGKGNYSGGLDDYFPMGYGETINGNLWDGVSTESKLFLGTGKATVKVTGGTVGSVNGIDATGRMTTGNVFGGSQGEAAPNIFNQPADDYNPVFHLANINEADVTIGTEGSATGPRIYGSVYGGGQDGHMRRDAKVTVYSGEIGNAYNDANKTAVGTSDLNNLQWEQRGNVFGAGSGFGLYSFDYNHNGKTYTDTNGNGRYDDGEPIDTYEFGGQTYYDMGVSYLAGCVARFSEVNIKGGIIHRNVYGGGSVAGTGEPKFGYQTFEPYKKDDPDHGQGTQSQSTVTVSGGTIGESGYGGNVFGASRGNELLLEADERLTTCIWTEVNVEGGTIWSDVYGGGELGTVKQDTEVNLTGGEIYGSVYGGGKGTSAVAADIGSTLPAPPVLGGNTSVFLNGSTATGATNDCKVRGNIFGCNNINGTPKGHALVHIYKTEGYDDSHKKSAAKDNTTYDVAAVYGGGNMAAYEPKSDAEFSEVIIDGCDFTSIQYVYGGGNAASAPATYVKVNATYEIGTVFGGGNGKDNLPNGDPNPGAHVGYKADGSTSYGTGQAKVDALGGTIHNVFGGSNTKGNIRSEAVAFLDQQDDTCPLVLGEVYGGGNEAYMEGGSSLKLGCISSLKNLYGGANDAPVGGDINLTVTSGRFERVFGGNNKGGTISGSITVNIEETGCHPIIIGELYGCGNKAGYSATTMQPTINVKSFTSIGRVFGGGLGETAIVEGNPILNVNVVPGEKKDGEPTDTEFFDAEGNFKGWNIEFKDGTDPDVVTSTVSLPTHTKGEIGAIGTVFGGGNAAKVDGNTSVNIGTEETITYISGDDHTPKTVIGANIVGNVFGGGNAAEVTGNTDVKIGK